MKPYSQYFRDDKEKDRDKRFEDDLVEIDNDFLKMSNTTSGAAFNVVTPPVSPRAARGIW